MEVGLLTSQVDLVQKQTDTMADHRGRFGSLISVPLSEGNESMSEDMGDLQNHISSDYTTDLQSSSIQSHEDMAEMPIESRMEHTLCRENYVNGQVLTNGSVVVEDDDDLVMLSASTENESPELTLPSLESELALEEAGGCETGSDRESVWLGDVSTGVVSISEHTGSMSFEATENDRNTGLSRQEHLTSGCQPPLSMETIQHDQVSQDSNKNDKECSATRARSHSESSNESGHVDWEELQKSEDQERKGCNRDSSTAFLLARLESENNALAKNPKSCLNRRDRDQAPPPSRQQIKNIITEPTPALRYSLLPSPPPMTELEFWTALVKDYPRTATRLPTLTANKIRAGIPPPLRGVVWVSMAGARDSTLDETYQRLSGETSPYENIIGKDIGRSFPGVDMFKDANGEGQRMLGKVLRCFSLYDNQIGYCQGLGFLVGPLLMQMGDKEAFCVLVRLMEDYGLRSCFLPDLSGLHLRIYQFQQLLNKLLPNVAAHLNKLQIEAAYLSQWFLSFFAVTCPLPILFRIYDMIFAEGASETVMRVALSLMRRNEAKIMASNEFEEVMQLLLSRSLWDAYGCNANSGDALLQDFDRFTSVVTRDQLQNLETKFKDERKSEVIGATGVRQDVQVGATSFLGRLWVSSSPPKLSNRNSVLCAPTSSTVFLRRTTSKQSLASIVNSIDGSTESSVSTAMTALSEDSTSPVRGATDAASFKSPDSVNGSIRYIPSTKDRDLHVQIEDLLTALCAMQRQHAIIAEQLQKEREERTEEMRDVKVLVDRLKSCVPCPSRRRNTVSSMFSSLPVDIPPLLMTISSRLDSAPLDFRSNYDMETNSSLRSALTHTQRRLEQQTVRVDELERRLDTETREASTAKEQLDESKRRLQDSYRERVRLEQTVSELRAASKSASSSANRSSARSDGGVETNISSSAGLRELKLGRARPGGSSDSCTIARPYNKRTSSLLTQGVIRNSCSSEAPTALPAQEALLLELVNAKTSEAIARQELDEMKGKFEAMRKLMNGAALASANNFAPEDEKSAVSKLASVKESPPRKQDTALVDRLADGASSERGAAAAVSGITSFWGWGKKAG